MFCTTEFQIGNTDSQVIRTSPAIILVRISEGHLNTYSIYVCVCVSTTALFHVSSNLSSTNDQLFEAIKS
jgi:hypothetical protein